MAKIDRFLKLTIGSNASDLHLAAGEIPRLRVDGELVKIDHPLLSSEDLKQLLLEMMTDEEAKKFLTNRNLDKSYSLSGVANFRCNIFLTRKGAAAVFRVIPTDMPSLETLAGPSAIMELAKTGKGLVLITGPTGSGKSTTLAAIINYINEHYPLHILTIEDPVEFVHKSKKSLINQREIGSSCLTFADALKYSLREDPDVILVGELRDLETISLALTAAETGHLVFGTLHTRGAAASVDRIIDSFPANQQEMIRTMLAESLVAVVSQALLKKSGGTGRVAAFEIMLTNHAISNLIREGKTFQISSIMQTARKEGMVLMDQYIVELCQQGLVTKEEATAYLENPAALAGVGIIPQKKAAPTPPEKPPERREVAATRRIAIPVDAEVYKPKENQGSYHVIEASWNSVMKELNAAQPDAKPKNIFVGMPEDSVITDLTSPDDSDWDAEETQSNIAFKELKVNVSPENPKGNQEGTLSSIKKLASIGLPNRDESEERRAPASTPIPTPTPTPTPSAPISVAAPAPAPAPAKAHQSPTLASPLAPPPLAPRKKTG